MAQPVSAENSKAAAKYFFEREEKKRDKT